MGPVHENDTNTRVRAMKNTPTKPPLSALASLLLTSELGNTISNAPRNDAANIMNVKKNMILGIQWVDSQLNMSAVTASPPAM